uniref:Small membrane protein n=1 Tax=Heterorhabditis bacteriophora TaxID=37862 RepID=A0A1I7X6T2_HETBA
MVDLKQQLNAIDYFGVVAVWLCFFSIIFIISVTCILWCCVSKDDDSTVFAKYGMGPRQRTPPQKYEAQVEKAE